MSWMLDTNAVSDLLKNEPGVQRHVAASTVGTICLSAVTVGEIHYGLARRPGRRALHEAVRQLLLRTHIVPWTDAVAETCGALRAELESAGQPLAALDTMIAAHARHLGHVLVSNDKAFRNVSGLTVEDWRQTAS